MFKYSRKILCALLAAMMIISTSGAALAASVGVKVNTSGARFYKSASTKSASLPMKKGVKLTLTGVNGKWARVKYKGVTGYCALSALNTTKRYGAYAKSGTYIYKSASASSAKTTLPVNTKIYIIGKSGSFYRVQNASGSITGYVKTSKVSKTKVSTAKPASYYKSKVVKMNWYGSGQNVLKKDQYGYIYDIASGQTIRIKRMGGSNHADVEPATKADTAKLKSLGGGYSWDSRAVILIANGKYVACAINTQPHGDETITNNGYDGQFCLHMIGSKTHGSDSVNSAHQAAIEKAYKWARG